MCDFTIFCEIKWWRKMTYYSSKLNKALIIRAILYVLYLLNDSTFSYVFLYFRENIIQCNLCSTWCFDFTELIILGNFLHVSYFLKWPLKKLSLFSLSASLVKFISKSDNYHQITVKTLLCLKINDLSHAIPPDQGTFTSSCCSINSKNTFRYTMCLWTMYPLYKYSLCTFKLYIKHI